MTAPGETPPGGQGGAGPLDDAAFAAAIAPLGPWLPDRPDMPPVGLAVSGGADSLCLAFLAGRWRRRVRALIVDHGLRAASGGEARLTRDRLHAMGIPADILMLDGLHPGPGLADRARRARYAALARACRAYGIVDLLLGHHADDQAETILIRRRAASGPDGLAGMARVSILPDMRLVRPLLSFGRDRLRATLRHAGLEWVEDPSNADPCAERARVRAALAHDPDRAAQALLEAGRQGAARMARDVARAARLADTATAAVGGWVALRGDPSCPRDLALLIRAVSGRDYPPSARAVAALCAGPRAVISGAVTLGGVCLVPAGAALRRAGLSWLLVREEAAMQPPVPARPGGMWDGRFVLCAPPGTDLSGVTIGAAGPPACWAPRHWRSVWPARALRTAPALHRAGRVVAVPGLAICHAPDLAAVRLLPAAGAAATESARFAGGPGAEF
ncbi:tRNA lysidine(34) synthetase TilS [Nguyenibacter vanlangensis]|uniref:tRNA(Ile)-lysidine synthase n=1 Tax=Nguyenibacter vanlangensis TaxID=1216886 RepID=A0ABZ3D4L2_9PROT